MEKPTPATDKQPEPSNDVEPEVAPVAPGDPVRTASLSVALFVALVFVWYVFADRYAPWTDQARVEAFVVPITPEVSGDVIEVNVTTDQVVKSSELLARIDPREYQLAVQRAEANLEMAGQQTGADTAAVSAAEASVAEARAQSANAAEDFDRVERIYRQDPGAVSKAYRSQVKAAVAKSEAREANALADLEQAKQQLGQRGEDNPMVREAVAALEQARIDLAETRLLAPSDGGITNLRIDEGQYASAGTPLMTFTSFTDVWIKAYLRENSMEHLTTGDRVDIVLDAAPGRVFAGTISSVGFAVQQPSGGAVGELETVKNDSGWLRSAQRFPVIIQFADDKSRGFRRIGGQADVQIYSGDNAVLNLLGRLWIRFMSVLSYVY